CCFEGSPGICTTDSNCGSFGGFTVTGFCPGPNSNRCCVVDACDGAGSQCFNSPTECVGGHVTGLCPGGNDFSCC
ncbi:hypothetical protein K438DRAFT_1524142, partial [Mycena galopus ATCC 62051]